MKNILVTDYQGPGQDESVNMMIFTDDYIPVSLIEKKLQEAGDLYTDIIIIKDDDLQYYLYDYIHLSGVFIMGKQKASIQSEVYKTLVDLEMSKDAWKAQGYKSEEITQ